MGDVITVRCVLVRDGFQDPGGKCDGLAFINPAQRHSPWHWIACHAKGTPPPPIPSPCWEYEVRGDRLFLTPSLLDRTDQFHTDLNWNVAFSECPHGKPPFDFFLEINPEVRP